MLPSEGQKTLPSAIPFEDVTDEAEDLLDGRTFYGCESSDSVCRSVGFRKIVDLDERFSHLSAGKLKVLHHPPMFVDDVIIEGFTEYRLESAIVLNDGRANSFITKNRG